MGRYHIKNEYEVDGKSQVVTGENHLAQTIHLYYTNDMESL